MPMSWKTMLIKLLMVRDGKKCKLCGDSFVEIAPPEVDHIVPRAAGGNEEPENLQLVHHICNVRKGSMGNGRKRGRKESKVSLVEGSRNIWSEVDCYLAREMQAALILNSYHQKATARALGMGYRSFRHYAGKLKLRLKIGRAF